MGWVTALTELESLTMQYESLVQISPVGELLETDTGSPSATLSSQGARFGCPVQDKPCNSRRSVMASSTSGRRSQIDVRAARLLVRS